MQSHREPRRQASTLPMHAHSDSGLTERQCGAKRGDGMKALLKSTRERRGSRSAKQESTRGSSLADRGVPMVWNPKLGQWERTVLPPMPRDGRD